MHFQARPDRERLRLMGLCNNQLPFLSHSPLALLIDIPRDKQIKIAFEFQIHFPELISFPAIYVIIVAIRNAHKFRLRSRVLLSQDINERG